MSLNIMPIRSALASLDVDPCGTKVPGRPFPPRGGLLEAVGLNPQPLPPRDGGGGPAMAARMFDDIDFCGTKPRPFPPLPNPPWPAIDHAATMLR